jgi:hypothetical protein
MQNARVQPTDDVASGHIAVDGTVTHMNDERR